MKGHIRPRIVNRSSLIPHFFWYCSSPDSPGLDRIQILSVADLRRATFFSQRRQTVFDRHSESKVTHFCFSWGRTDPIYFRSKLQLDSEQNHEPPFNSMRVLMLKILYEYILVFLMFGTRFAEYMEITGIGRWIQIVQKPFFGLRVNNPGMDLDTIILRKEDLSDTFISFP
jgi:hypothetical protein